MDIITQKESNCDSYIQKNSPFEDYFTIFSITGSASAKLYIGQTRNCNNFSSFCKILQGNLHILHFFRQKPKDMLRYSET